MVLFWSFAPAERLRALIDERIEEDGVGLISPIASLLPAAIAVHLSADAVQSLVIAG